MALPEPSFPYWIAALLGPATWAAPGTAVELSYAFPSSGGDVTFAAIADHEQRAVEQALATWSAVAGVSFRRIADASAAQIRFAYADLPGQIAGLTSGTPGTGAGIDIQIDISLRASGLATGSGQRVLIHEVGHALGLKHPGDYDEASDHGTPPFLDASEDHLGLTQLSYHEPADWTPALNRGLRAFDIAAAQFLFGVRAGVSAGDSWHRLSATPPALQLIADGGGADLLDASGLAPAGGDAPDLLLDLRPGARGSMGASEALISAAGQFAINPGTLIEHALGTAGRDAITGNAVANALDGAAGDDTLEGLAGDDTLAGGAGADTLDGGDGDDWLIGGAGSDLFIAGAGADSVFGGPGVDVLRVAGSRLDFDLAPDGAGGGWTLQSIADAAQRVRLWGVEAVLFDDARADIDAAPAAPPLVASDLLLAAVEDQTLALRLPAPQALGSSFYEASLAQAPQHGAAALTADGLLVYRGDADFAGRDTLRLRYDDGAGSFAVVNVTIDVAAVNDAPHGSDLELRMAMGSVANGRLPAATDAEGGAVVYRVDQAPLRAQLTIAADGSFSYTPPTAFSGWESFRYAVTDAGGASQSHTVWVYVAALGWVESSPAQQPEESAALVGTGLVDLIYGGSGNDTVTGGAGADSLFGDAAADSIDGGDGADLIVGDGQADAARDGADTLDGGAGDDTLFGGGGSDVLRPGAGNDLVDAGPGAETMDGGLGNDSLFGGAGDDSLVGGDGNDQLVGDDFDTGTVGGNDTLAGGSGNDSLYGNGGNDSLDTGSGTNLADGGAGDDSVSGGDGADSLYGGDGNDRLLPGAGADLVEAGPGDDSVDGAAGNDRLFGNAGRDTLAGGDGDDEVTGDDFDALTADADDSLDGGAGNDTLNGNGGHDLLVGGAGNDVLDGRADDDRLFGGIGDDSLYGDDGDDWLDAGAGASLGVGGAGQDTLLGGDGIDTLFGGDGNDVASGGPGNDVLDLGAGNDSAAGGAGFDALYGSDGDDWLVDAADGSFLDGGAGADTLVFDWAAGALFITTVQGGEGVDTLIIRVASTAGLPAGAAAEIDALRADLGTPRVLATLALATSGFEQVLVHDASQQHQANRAPFSSNLALRITEDQAFSGTLPPALDLEGGGTSWARVSEPTLGTANVQSDGRLTYTPRADANGIDSFEFRVSDALGASRTYTVQLSIAALPDAPRRVAPLADQQARSGVAFALEVPAGAFVDGDGDALAFSATLADGKPLPAWLGFDAATRRFSGTPGPADGATLQVRVAASDGTASDFDLFALVVQRGDNVAPTVPGGDGGSATVSEDGVLRGRLPTATDADGDAVAYAAQTGPAHGVLALDADGHYVYRPAPNVNGEDAFGFSVSDGHGGTTVYTQRIAITAVNDLPSGSIAISGRLEPGELLQASAAITDADGLGSINWQWLRGQTPIAGATHASYRLGPEDAGQVLRVRASYVDGGGSAESLVSAPTERVLGVATITGSAGSDRLVGTDGRDLLLGLEANDVLVGGAGSDTLDGGEGYDVADYRGELAVAADLGAGSASCGEASDTLIGIEALFGSQAADTLRGRIGVPGRRDETLRGGGGDDTLLGGDAASFGDGVDTAEFMGARSGYRVERGGDGSLLVTDIDPGNGDEGVDRLVGIERLVFADQLLAFGSRAEEVLRVAFVLWTPQIIDSPQLFSRGLSYYDVGYTIHQLYDTALGFWPEQGQAFAELLLRGLPASTKTVGGLLQLMEQAGGGEAGRRAALDLMTVDAALDAAIAASGVLETGLVASLVVQDFGTLFQWLPG